MIPDKSEAERREKSAEQLLLEYFLVGGPPWPGGDALTTDDVIRGYVAAMQNGRVPSLDELSQRHPDLAVEFRMLLESHKL